MYCTFCRSKLDPVIYAYVWRTVEPISVKPFQWAHMPIHIECKELIEREYMKSKIAIAAGHDTFAYSIEKPTLTNWEEFI